MLKFFLNLIVIFMIFFPVNRVIAESEKGSNGRIRPREHLGIIIFSGLGGGLLGLSTLSFYSRPQERLQNIGYGFAVGIILGTLYTTYNAATQANRGEEKKNYDAFEKLYEDPFLRKTTHSQNREDWFVSAEIFQVSFP